ncbi:MAG: hypothetical protein ACD_79C01131G0001 [uncultured bacterium]|nr:MAG: hypothetical protein ACD_79C01131G0001 [uncultured bacterium]
MKILNLIFTLFLLMSFIYSENVLENENDNYVKAASNETINSRDFFIGTPFCLWFKDEENEGKTAILPFLNIFKPRNSFLGIFMPSEWHEHTARNAGRLISLLGIFALSSQDDSQSENAGCNCGQS